MFIWVEYGQIHSSTTSPNKQCKTKYRTLDKVIGQQRLLLKSPLS